MENTKITFSRIDTIKMTLYDNRTMETMEIFQNNPNKLKISTAPNQSTGNTKIIIPNSKNQVKTLKTPLKSTYSD